jgi:hypothetical protein
VKDVETKTAAAPNWRPDENMSDATLDQESVIVRIRRVITESGKLSAEREKLYAESLKLGLERWLAPIIAIRGLIVGAMGIMVAFAGLVLWQH